MGTNAAPPFANLIDRYYEILCPLPGVRGFMHNRFIDDLFLLHPVAWAPHVVAHLQRVYPPHLPFEVQHFCKQEHVDFLDVFVISLRGELRYCTNFKRTNYGVYMPWRSNNPRTHKLSWIKAERARYLRTNSHSVYFDVVSERLSLCLARLHYPRCAFESLPLSWSMKPRYMNRKERAAPDRSIHVLRAPFHASMDFSLSRLLRWVQRRLTTHIPGVRLFVTYKPMPNMRAVWHRLAMSTLRASGEGGRVDNFSPELTVQDLIAVGQCDLARA